MCTIILSAANLSDCCRNYRIEICTRKFTHVKLLILKKLETREKPAFAFDWSVEVRQGCSAGGVREANLF